MNPDKQTFQCNYFLLNMQNQISYSLSQETYFCKISQLHLVIKQCIHVLHQKEYLYLNPVPMPRSVLPLASFVALGKLLTILSLLYSHW